MSRNRKGLAVLMKTPMSAAAMPAQPLAPTFLTTNDSSSEGNLNDSYPSRRVGLDVVKERMHASITVPTDKIDFLDANLEEFSMGYLSLPQESRRELILGLTRDYDVNRARVRELMEQYLNLGLPQDSDVTAEELLEGGVREEAFLASCYRMERNIRIALKPMYDVFFERLNAHPGGLKILTALRADLLSVIE